MPAFLAACIMVILKATEWVFHTSFASYGLRPGETRGLIGILTFPFLHGDGMHLLSNLFPFIFLSTLVYNLIPKIFWKVYGFTFVLSGFWTWCFARPGVVIGASGWVYALLGFLLIAGFARLGRKTMVIAGGLAFLYGGMVYGLGPTQPHISWEGHLMGLLSGATAAIYWRKDLKEIDAEAKPKSPTVEQDPPYPFWMYPVPHFVDSQKKVIAPEHLIWENGSPRLKTQEELLAESQPQIPETENKTPSDSRQKGFTDGIWTYHIS